MLNLGRREVSSSRGKKPKSYKYNGANVLIIGSSDPVGQAMVELALREGANVFATSERSHRQYMQNMGATWFPNDPEKLVQLKGTMDVVVDTMCLDGYRSSYEALHRNGKLICTSNPPKQNDATLFQQWGKSWSTFHANHIWPDVKVYDIHKSFKDDRQTFEHDFKHLLHKLDRGDIRPKISGVIALNQVPKAQRLIEKGLPNGTVVVLPWAELDATQHVPKEVFH
jgi:NADPH:quinone reductase-like Zn-dependent oxidoreductase